MSAKVKVDEEYEILGMPPKNPLPRLSQRPSAKRPPRPRQATQNMRVGAQLEEQNAVAWLQDVKKDETLKFGTPSKDPKPPLCMRPPSERRPPKPRTIAQNTRVEAQLVEQNAVARSVGRQQNRPASPTLVLQSKGKSILHPSGLIPCIKNVVSTFNVGGSLDLKYINSRALNATYKPKRFNAVIMKINNPKTTALMFQSGKILCTGAQSEDDSKLAARKFAGILKKIGLEVRFVDFQVVCLVGFCEVGFPICLERLQNSNRSCDIQYMPEKFPGLLLHMKDPKCDVLVFASGKVVTTGVKDRETLYEGFENIYPLLKECKQSSPISFLETPECKM